MFRYSKIIFVSLFFFCSFFTAESFPQTQGIIDKIVDGDTFYITINGISEKVRLIGIDTPESRKVGRVEDQAERMGIPLEELIMKGKEATAMVSSIMAAGDTVDIEMDIRKRDQYGRLLVYIHLKDGRMLNEEIVKAGYAFVKTITPNVKYAERILKAYQEARENESGMWNPESKTD